MKLGVTQKLWNLKDITQNCEILFIDLRNIFPEVLPMGADRVHSLFSGAF